MQSNRSVNQDLLEIRKIEIDIPEIYFELSKGKSTDFIYYQKDEAKFEIN